MPHKKDHKIRVEDLFWQSPIPEPSLLPMAPNIAPGLFDEEFNETPDERMFRENEEFYKKHPTYTLELSPTGHTTQYGRKVYKDQFNAIHSETTVTVPAPNGGWMNIPSIYNGRYVTEDQARAIIIKTGMVDPETGEKVRSYESIPKAEEAAKQRMRTLNKKDQPWNKSAPKKDGSFLDWLIPKAGAAGLVPQERENLFNTDALQETRDRKLSPVEQLADTEFRVQLNPQGIAKYSDAYRNPTKHTGLAYTSRPTSQRGFYMDTPTATSENLWKDKSANEIFEPGQVFRHGKSYQITGNLDLKGQSPEDVIHHEAAHDAMTKAASLESMRAGFLDFDIWLDLISLEHGRPMGIDVQEALTRYHDIKYPKSEMATTDAELWLKEHIKHSRTEADKEGSHSFWTRYWEILVNELPKFYDALTESARKRHEALGYK